ncbi:MAG: hypothetical protein ABMA26_03140, partial [Limisphaerales bacterium]
RLELPPKPGAKAPAAAGGHEIKLLVPQVDESAASARIPETSEAEMPTMDSSQAAPAAPAAKPGGLKGGPPGSKPGGMLGKVAQAPASALPDSTPSAMALPAKKALPKPEMSSAPMVAAVQGGVRVRWFDITFGVIAVGATLGALVRLLMILGVF